MKNKIIIIGCPGSGKSYLTNILSKKYNIPKFHLDFYYWKENWEHLSKIEFDNLLDEIIENDEDINFANFLYNCKFYITDDFKQRKRLLYESHKAHGIIAEMLKKRFGIDESLIKLP